MSARLALLALSFAAALVPLPACPQDKSIVMASTTSTEQSGLFGHLLPRSSRPPASTCASSRWAPGQALDTARRGDADVVFVHDTAAEEKFVAEGFAPQAPAGHVQRLRPRRAEGRSGRHQGQRHHGGARPSSRRSGAPFVSRGDKSGTHAAELRYWKAAGIDIAAAKPAGYKECGCGMGPALNIASASNAYVLTDRGTWLSFKNRGDLAVLVEGDRRLFNQYGVMVVNPAKHPHVKTALAQQFADWLVSAGGPDGDRRLQDRRRAAVLSERREVRPTRRVAPIPGSRVLRRA